MKNLKDYLLEDSSEDIKTKEVVNTLKDGGETPQEIKKDVNVNKPTMTYIEFVKLFTKKCNEWCIGFINMHRRLLHDEGNDYLVRNLGEKWTKYFSESIKELGNAIKELNDILKQNVNEGLEVRKIDNYTQLYNFLVNLNKLNDLGNKAEKFYDDLSKYEDIVKARTNVSNSIEKLFKSTDLLKKFLETVYQFKNIRLH